MKENLLLEEAMAAFKKETGLQLRIRKQEQWATNRHRDALLILEDYGVEFWAEIKARAANLNIGALLNQMQRQGELAAGLLVTDYINPQLAEKLRAQHIQFVDTAGNAFINKPPIYIFTKGNRRTEQLMFEARTNGRAFKPTGLKVVFALLNHPELLNAPYRDIAKCAQVALGNIGGILGDLLNLGYIEESIRSKQKAFARFDNLVDKWVEAYPLTLRPKLLIGKYTPTNHQWFEQIDPHAYGGCWGGELAAWFYDRHLTPKVHMVYLDKHKTADFLQQARLKKMGARREPETEVLLLEKFWSIPTVGTPELAPPLVVYADLVATGDPRNLEAAERIRAKHFA